MVLRTAASRGESWFDVIHAPQSGTRAGTDEQCTV